ncbi:MAG: Acyl transferase domain-containing protein [Verrucomicrobia bacterium]|nr:MAG: Acyl transferase domain-containing protein [Verrucomicrobiota bacterium]
MNLSIQITASFTAEPLKLSLERWLDLTGIEATASFSDFNQVFQEALNPGSASARNSRGCNLFLIRLRDLAEGAEMARAAAARCEAQQQVFFCPDAESSPEAIELETTLIRSWASFPNVETYPSTRWKEDYSIREAFDPESDRAGKIPYTGPMFAAIAGLVVRRIHKRLRPAAKVLVLDADNTLWGGVCGEESPDALDVDGVFRELQTFARSKRAEGVLLSLCSKNAETDVDRIFAQRQKDLRLRREDFSGWKVNWNPKSQNLRDLAAELNLGLDSFVFLDDNPAEIAEVRANAPQVQALVLPADLGERSRFLRHLWALDPGETTGEDKLRAEFYATEAERQKVLSRSTSFADFLRGLDLEISIRPGADEDFPRLAQLSKRTNQFNASGLQVEAPDLAARVADGSGCLKVNVRDRFGDYGLVGAVLYRIAAGAKLWVDLFLLSCRALGKGVERSMLIDLAKRARADGAETLVFAFQETGRNEPCRRFLESVGAVRTRPEEFQISVALAETLSPIPQEGPVAGQASSGTENRSVSRPGLPSDLAAQIATRWWDADHVFETFCALRSPRPDMAQPLVRPGTEIQQRLADIWERVLGLDGVGIHDAFTALGGTSVQLVALHSAIRSSFPTSLELAELFELPTIAAQASALDGKPTSSARPEPTPARPADPEESAVAIIGMALRVPGANDPETFWNNLAGGLESISRFGRDELDDPENFGQPDYVPAKGLISGVDQFDAAFFGILPKEARLMDPQQRILLELAWEAMERAGYGPGTEGRNVGVYAGASFNTYLLANLCSDRSFLEELIPSIHAGSLQTVFGNDKDFLATRIAYKLNLRGPAVTVQTACSTSMVAVIEACRALRSGQCEMALAGGVAITLPLRSGYFYSSEGILSSDGHCRPFDAAATGTVFSNGGGVVLLKRLSDALRDGDQVHAVIRGIGLNNDGGVKHSYSSPSLEGQAEVIRMAQNDAGVSPGSIGYIEANGTGTPLGDPIEVSALTKAFRSGGAEENGFCVVGSLKPNIGHLDVASGVCGLIKAALCLEKRALPPTLHFRVPNPNIPFASSPFRVHSDLQPWSGGLQGAPRRAAVSSFGVGGTNAHVILEEAPERKSAASSRPTHLFLLSGRSPEALEQVAANLARMADDPGDLQPADAAWTLAAGRKPFRSRRAVAASGFSSLARALRSGSGFSGEAVRENPPVVFLFPDEESLQINMGRELYDSEPIFRRQVDACAEFLRPHLGLDLVEILYPTAGANLEEAERRLGRSGLAQPAMFTVAHALATSLIHWGIRPRSLIGCGVGEFVAATLSGVMTPEEALRLLLIRGRLMDEMPAGLEPFVPRFLESFQGVTLRAPQIPMVSTVSGDWLTNPDATDPGYWASQLAKACRFHQAVNRAATSHPGQIFVEIGPRQNLPLDQAGGSLVLAVCGKGDAQVGEQEQLLQTVGQLWIHGVEVDWTAFYAGETRRRVPLPAYPFERRRHWVDPTPRPPGTAPLSPLQTNFPQDVMAPTSSSSRTPELTNAVREILSDISGLPDRDLKSGASFLELGFDSLLLTQVSRALQNRFKTPITLRQMMSDLLTTDAMVSHLDSVLPPDAFSSAESPVSLEAPPAPVVPPSLPLSVGGSLESVIAAQLDLMRQQLNLLQGLPTQPAAPQVPSPLPQPPPTRKAVSAPDPVINRLFDEALTPSQSAHLRDLIKLYVARTPTSRDLAAQSQRWPGELRPISGRSRHWREINYPLTLAKSHGAKVVDADGNEYVDLVNGFAPNPLGHAPDVVTRALHAQIDRGGIAALEPFADLEVARLFCELTGNEQASSLPDASEARDAAIRLARSLTGRKKTGIFAFGPEGDSEEILNPHREGSDPNRIDLPFGSPTALETIRARAHELALVIVDPIQSCRPELQPGDFIRELRKLTATTGILFVFDETLTGFATGPGGAQAFYGVQADLVIHGETVGGGLPVGVLAGKTEWMNAFAEMRSNDAATSHRLSPLAMAAAKAVLQHLLAQSADFWSALLEKADRLARSVDRIFVETGLPLRMTQFGTRVSLRILDGCEAAGLIFFHLRLKGVFLMEGFPGFLTAAHTDRDVDFLIDAFRDSVDELQRSGFFESRPSLNPVASRSRIEPLSEPLAEIWLASQVSAESSLCFNEIASVNLVGCLDSRSLELALTDLLARHEALRACYLPSGEGFTAQPPARFSLPLEDFAALAAPDRKSAFERILQRERTTRFDLANGPLFRAVLVRNAAEEHVLVLNCHHLACDGWSYGVLLRELGELYSARRTGRQSALPNAASFTDFVRETTLSEDAAERDDAFWVSQFAEPVSPLRLPTDFAPPTEPNPKSDTVTCHLAPHQLATLKRCATESGATLFSLLLGTFQLLLHRISREQRFAVWFPAAGQSGNSPEHLIGHSVNALPLIAGIDLSGDFASHLRRIQARLLDSLEHQTTTYGRLIKTLGAEQRPQVEAIFNLERVHTSIPMEGLETRIHLVERTFSTHPLHLKAFETQDGLDLRCDFQTSLYERTTILAWMDTYLAMLDAAGTHRNGTVAEIASAISAAHRQQIQSWNQTRTDYPRHETLPGLFAKAVTAHPHAVALRSPQQSVTYTALNDLSDRMANSLRIAGAAPGTRIALFLDRSPSLYAAILGVLKAGCVYVPIDTQYPADRIQFLVEDSDCHLVITDQGLRQALPRGVPVLLINDALHASGPQNSLGSAAPTPDSAAVLIYTSGSTGNPKGALLSHRAIIRLVFGTDYAPFDADQRFIQMASICFDVSLCEVFGSLLHGARLVIPPPGALTIDGLADQIRDEGVTQLIMTAALFEAIADSRPDAFARVRQVITGGDVASLSHYEKIRDAHPACQLINAYGPTENTTLTTHHPLAPEDLRRARIPIGRPAANCTAWIVDARGELTPPGIPGELWAGGDGVALGYWNRPELSAARFVANPFESSPESRLYRTGDLCRLRPDGGIEFLGRIDQQVKIRGFRVEPEEVEVQLDRHPSVRQCKVAVLGEGSSGRFLAAYVALEPGATGSATAFAEYLRSKLPAYMVPSAITILDELPLTTNGKIDTRALAAPIFLPRPAESQDSGPILTPTEQDLAPLWNGALNLAETDLDADFFASGGHSLLGMKLLSSVQKKLGVSLPLGKLFQAPTLRLLAKEIELKRGIGQPSGTARSLVASGS